MAFSWAAGNWRLNWSYEPELRGGSENDTEQDFNSCVWTGGIPDDKMTYQVLPQLFVVGNDAIVNDDKLWEETARGDRLDKEVKGQQPVLLKLL